MLDRILDLLTRIPTIMAQSRMRTRGFLDLQHMPKTDQGRETLSNSPDGLVRLAHKLAKSLTKTSSKVRKPLTYDEVINDPVHGNRWRKAIDEKLWNLDSYQTWAYTSLPVRQKVISCKWSFKVKYHLDGSIERYKGR